MRRDGGFTLIEVMMAVSIVGILAIIAIPNFTRVTAKAKQTEAKSNLNAIAALEASYHGESQTYGSFEDLGYAIDGESRYLFCLGFYSGPDENRPLAYASAQGSVVGGPSNARTGGSPHPLTRNPPSSTLGGTGTSTATSSAVPFGVVAPAFFVFSPGFFAMRAHGGSTLVCPGNPHYDESTFEVDAVARISDAPAPNDLDVWSIDQTHELLNVNVGY